jgi:hypothetical protein
MASGRLFATNDIEEVARHLLPAAEQAGAWRQAACCGEREALRAFWLAAGDRALSPCITWGRGRSRQKNAPASGGGDGERWIN